MRKFYIPEIVIAAGFLVIGSLDVSANGNDAFITKEKALKAAGLDSNVVDENEKIMLTANANEERFKTELGDTYGGSWIDYDSSGKAYQVVAAVDLILVSKRYTQQVNLKIVEVKYSLNELESLRNLMVEKFFNLKDSTGDVLLLSLDADPKRNKVIVGTKSSNIEAIKSIFKENKLNSDMLDFDIQAGPEKPAAKTSLYGGGSIVTANRGTPSSPNAWKASCTAGFNARLEGTHTGVIVTAGHCEYVDDTEAVYIDSGGHRSPRMGAYIGDFLANSYYKDNVDGVLYGNVNEVYDLVPLITRGPLADFNVKPVLSITNAMRGRQICAYGKMNGWRCGRLSSVDTVVNRGGRPLRLSIAEFCVEEGDSGGPVVYPENGSVAASSGNAVGIISGYIDNGNLGCRNDFSGAVRTTIQPLSTYLAKWPSVRLLTR